MKWNDKRKIFARFFLGISTREEDRIVFDSKESDEMLIQVWENDNELKTTNEYFNKAGVYEIIRYQMENRKKVSKIKQLTKFLQKYAAAFLIGLIIGSMSLFFGIIKPFYINTLTMVEVNNPYGKRTQIELPDGTTVMLNAGTQIIYPKKFNRNQRLVTLSGEAFFDVKKNPDKPFIIKTGELSVEVLGTTFNLMAYPNDNTIETTLVTGKVLIKRKNPVNDEIQKLLLTPNQKAIYTKDEEHFIVESVDVKFDTSWKNGILLFDNEPFEEVAKKLERWYNTPIELSDDLKGMHRFTMTLKNETLNEVLDMIKKTSPVNYTWANGKVIFYNLK